MSRTACTTEKSDGVPPSTERPLPSRLTTGACARATPVTCHSGVVFFCGSSTFGRMVACCRFRGHEDKIVTMGLESGYDETEVQPRVQDRGGEAGDGAGCGGGAGRA